MNSKECSGPAGVLSLDDAIEWRRKAGRDGKRVVFTNGCFDLLHRGHVVLLQKARRLGDCLITGLNSDDSVRRLKGQERPRVGQEDRAFVLSSLRCVDCVVVFEEDTPLRIVELLRPDILVKGGDYTVDEVVGKDAVEREGGRVVIVPYVEGCSTSALLGDIRPHPLTPDQEGD